MSFRRRKIRTGQTLGGLIKSNRRKNKITLEQAEEHTKIRSKYLKAIEEDDWDIFSSRVYALGFVRRYCDYLGLDGKGIAEEYKGEFSRVGSPKVKMAPATSRLEGFILTPKVIITVLSCLAVLFVIFYIGFSINSLSKPPFINIISPLEENISEESIVIEGRTLDTAVIEINEKSVSVDENGYFNQKVELDEGLNVFEITARSRLGKESSKMLKVYFEDKNSTEGK